MSKKRAIYIASAVVVPLSLLYYQPLSSSNYLLTPILFNGLFPGSITQLALTGDHGSSFAIDYMLAPILGAAVNILVYSLLIIWGAKFFQTVTPK